MNGVSRELIVAASMLIRIANPEEASLLRALDRAQERVLHLPWQVDGDTLQIASYKTPGVMRHTDGEYCDCETRRGVCWHRAAWLLLCTVAAATFGQMPFATQRPEVSRLEYDDRDLTDPTRDDYPANLDIDHAPITTPPPAPPPSYGSRYGMSDAQLERRRKLAQAPEPAVSYTPGPRRELTDEERIHAIDAAGRKASRWTDEQRRAAFNDLFG